VTTVDSTPPVVICPELIDPSARGGGLGGVATDCLVVDRAIG